LLVKKIIIFFEKEVHKMTVVVKKVPKALRGIVKFLFKIKE